MSGRDKFGGRRLGKPRKINGKMPNLVKRRGGVKADPRPARNEPCSCGSGKKFKRCHGAPPKPICSVKDCDEPVRFFLSPSVGGERSDSHYWLACEGHVQDISAGAAAQGMDVDVIPFDSITGRTIARDGLEVVHEPILPDDAEPDTTGA